MYITRSMEMENDFVGEFALEENDCGSEDYILQLPTFGPTATEVPGSSGVVIELVTTDNVDHSSELGSQPTDSNCLNLINVSFVTEGESDNNPSYDSDSSIEILDRSDADQSKDFSSDKEHNYSQIASQSGRCEEQNSQSSTSSSDLHLDRSKKGKQLNRRSYTVKEKIEAVKRLRECGNNINSTARLIGVPRKTLAGWTKNYDQFLQLNDDRDHCSRKIRKVPRDSSKASRYPELETALVLWVKEQRDLGLPVSGDLIQIVAREKFKVLYPQNDQTDFKASKGWLNRFLIREHITMRQVTSYGQKVPGNAKSLAESFLAFIQRYCAENDGKRIHFGNMDEVPVYFDMPHSRTYDLTGQKNVTVKTSGREKMRFTVVLTCLADGRKLQPLVIFRGLKDIPKALRKGHPKVAVAVNKSGSVNRAMMGLYIKGVWRLRPGGFFANSMTGQKEEKWMLIFDSHKAHTTEENLNHLKRTTGTDVSVIPGGMTPILQPLDVSINRSFKVKLRQEWRQWMSTVVNKTPIPKAPYGTVCDWVERAWSAIPDTQIIEAFRQCGIGKNVCFTEYHRRLNRILVGETDEIEEEEEATGVTDDEEETQENETQSNVQEDSIHFINARK